jgi:hydroxymethylbilane synthase
MRKLEGGCSVPIGVNTRLENNTLWLHGLVASLDGQHVVEHQDKVSLEEAKTQEAKEALAETLGRSVAEVLLKNGADKILEELAHK